MLNQTIDIEGTREQTSTRAPDFAGRKLLLTVLPCEDVLLPQPAAGGIDKRTLDEKLADIAASIPPEELAKRPSDLCDQINHYAYGTPKR